MRIARVYATALRRAGREKYSDATGEQHKDQEHRGQIFGCEREMQPSISAIWKRRYPKADHAQWVEWYAMTREFHRGVENKVK